MAYIGREPINGFHAKQQITGDGSTVTFTLDQTVAKESAIIVSVGGVIQEPSVAFDLSNGGASITFTAAPSSTDRVYVQFLGTAIVQNLLDADNDTSFTADTDDEVDIKVAGSDISTIKATGFHNLDSIKYVAGTGDDLQLYHDGTNSFLTNSTGALKLATETSGIAVTIGHTTSEVTIGDNMTVTGNLTVGGTTNFGDFNITNVGSIALDTITNDGTDITLDSSGDIILDSDGADVIFKDAGTEISRFTNSSSDFIIQTAVSDKDFVIKGNDGGATITPFTLDMSAGGDLFLTGGLIDLKNDGSAVSQIKFYCESSNAHAQTLIGAPHSESATNTLTLPSTGGNSYLVTAASTATLTNKTLTDAVAITNSVTGEIVPGKIEGTNFGGSLLVGHATTGSGNSQFNTGVGLLSIDALTSGDENSALGYQAGSALSTGTQNVIMGGQTMQYGTASTRNTAIGYQAGRNISGNDNIVLGNEAGENITSGAGNVIIGSVNAGSATGNRQLVIAGNDESTTTTWISGDSSGNLTFAGDVTVGDDLNLTTDSTVINFGADSDTTLTHTDGAGLTLNSTNKLMFNDASQFIHAPSATVLDIGATDEIELTATLIDVVGNLTVSGTIVSTGTITGTLATASQTNITSLGTLTTLTVDNVIINGSTIGHTGDTDLITVASGVVTVAGEVSMTTLDIGGTNVTATAAELNYSDGVTSAIQTQLDTKPSSGKAIAFALIFGR